ncbi:tRNA methyltransferase tyw3 [Chamberlinius hualienensis]
MENFVKIKRSILSSDNSIKGSVDKLICGLIDYINSLKQFATTSSCSGRIIVVQQSFGIDESCKKQGCKWLYTSHEVVDEADLINSLLSAEISNAVFKFEPFVLHVQCETVEDARKVHSCAIASGFRNSGISISKKGKIIAAVRSTHGLEVPLSDEKTLLVSHEYIGFLVKIANGKMAENEKRIKRSQLQQLVEFF